MGDYVVRYAGEYWVVQGPAGVEVRHTTQQGAIDAAKQAALRERVDVRWTDRDGHDQGHARFRSSNPVRHSIYQRNRTH